VAAADADAEGLAMTAEEEAALRSKMAVMETILQEELASLQEQEVSIYVRCCSCWLLHAIFLFGTTLLYSYLGQCCYILFWDNAAVFLIGTMLLFSYLGQCCCIPNWDNAAVFILGTMLLCS